MTLQEIKDNEAQKYGHSTFNDFLEHAKNIHNGTCYDQMEKMLNNVATIYAQEKCKEQREICADKAELDYDSEDCTDAGINESAFFVEKSSILNAPEPTFD